MLRRKVEKDWEEEALLKRKIKDLKELINKTGCKVDIEVDGGIKTDNVCDVLQAGANIVVAGSAVFNGDIEKNVSDFLEILEA